MSRSWATDRALVEPTAALAAVFAVCAATVLYAGVLGDAVPASDRELGDPTLTRVHDATRDGGVVRPARLPKASDAGPRGHRLNVTLRAGGERWYAGPATPTKEERIDRASRVVSVRFGPGNVTAGRLAVAVWP